MMSVTFPKCQRINNLSIPSARLAASASRPSVFCQASRLVLQPIGDGNTAHIKGSVDVEPAPALVLPEGIHELGRVEPADIIVPLPTVSGRHCMIRVEEDKKVFVTDLGSTNGTSIDKMELEPMKSALLPLNSVIVFGDKHLAAYQLVEDEYESDTESK